jgi:hypothetical protein
LWDASILWCSYNNNNKKNCILFILEYVSPYSYTSKIEIAFGYFLTPWVVVTYNFLKF